MKRSAALMLMALLMLQACGRSVDPATAVDEATALLESGKAGEARILLKSALAKAGDVPGARVLLARMSLDEGNARAAGDELSTLDAASAATPAAVLVRIDVALAQGRVDEARKLLEQSGDALPEPERILRRAALLRTSGEHAEALLGLRAVQQGMPRDERLSVDIAGSLAAMGELTAAIAELDRHLGDPGASRADALRTRGDLKLRQGLPEAAVKDLRAAVEAAPPGWPQVKRISTELLIADALLADGNLAEARAQLVQLDKRWPGMNGTGVLLAQLAMREGRHAEAVERLDALVELAPDNVRLQDVLVDALVRSGNLARATELLEQRVAADPDPASTARRALAVLMMQQGRPDRVIALLGEQTAGEAQAAGQDDLLASARLARARATQAIATLTTRLQAAPEDPALRAALAAAHVANGEPAAALAVLGPAPERAWTPELAAARAGALLATNNEFEINRLLERLLDPDTGADVATLIATADVLHRRRNEAAVSRLLDRAAVLDPHNVPVQMRQANLAFEGGRYDDAARALQAVTAREPGNMTAKVAMARVAEARGDVDGARKLLRDVIAQAKDAIEPALQLAAIELRANRTREANAAIDALLAANASGEAAYAAGAVLAQFRHLEEARSRFRQAVDRSPEQAAYWASLGEVQLTLADRQAARESFVRAAGLQPDALRPVAVAIGLSIQQKDTVTARRIAEATLRALPDSAGAWLLQGEAAAAQGQLEAAGEAFGKSYSIHPTAAAAIGEFRSRVQRGNLRADAPLRSWLSREPADLPTRRMLADHYIAAGRDSEAREQLELTLRRVPNDLATLNNLAWLLRDTDRARAERLALQANAIAPENPEVADTLGVILIGNGKPAQAVELLAKATSARPTDRSMQYHHALALSRAGRNQEAREVLGKLLSDDVQFTERADARRLMEETGS